MTNFCCSLIFQKKAEEAHKILEGLGPKVELVCDLMKIIVVLLFELLMRRGFEIIACPAGNN